MMRYERKYKVGDFSLSLAHQAIKLHPASFQKIFPDRQINNIYFDTPNYTAYKENVLGSPERKKYRIRWYGNEPSAVHAPKLEIKIKKNELGAKQLYQLPSFDIDDRPTILQLVQEQLPVMGALRPVLLNAYRRSYYGTRDGHFRITVDSDLRYCSLVNSLTFSDFQKDDPAVVLELKYNEDQDEAAQRIMQYLPFRQTKSSKYVQGVSLTS